MGNEVDIVEKVFSLVDQLSLHLPLFYAVSTECDQVLNPCGNSGNCTQFGSTVLCRCLPDFTGMFCEQGEHPQLFYRHFSSFSNR